MNTLKENYEKNLLLMEAFDKKQIAAAVEIVKKLKNINFLKITTLENAKKAAVDEITSVLAGNREQGVIRTVIGLFKEKENPLIDVLAFSDALVNFFESFTEYMDALNTDNEYATLGTVLTGMKPQELERMTAALPKEAQVKINNFQKIISNGLKPEGRIANLSKNWITKYLKGQEGLKKLSFELLKISIKDLKTLSASVVSSLKPVEQVSDQIAAQAQQTAPQKVEEKPATSTATKNEETVTFNPANIKDIAQQLAVKYKVTTNAITNVLNDAIRLANKQ